MTVKEFTVNPFAENTYIVHDDGDAVVIDPGYYGASERAAALEYIADHELSVRRLLLTHAHVDHIIDCAYWFDSFGMSFEMHEADLPLIERAAEQAAMFGVQMHDPPIPSIFFSEDDTIEFGAASWRIMETPGHSPGSVCFYDEANGFVISGDVLFQSSIGRTDLWKGSMDTLLDSIKSKLLALPDDTVVYPGHGLQTTIRRERSANPFLQVFS
jgi:glyoxylase-like metal-dependent hydrolase (beta-lactamase superfamily II)